MISTVFATIVMSLCFLSLWTNVVAEIISVVAFGVDGLLVCCSYCCCGVVGVWL